MIHLLFADCSLYGALGVILKDILPGLRNAHGFWSVLVDAALAARTSIRPRPQDLRT